MKDIQQVLAEKLRELRQCQQQIACLKIVLPLLVEPGDPEPEPAPAPETGAAAQDGPPPLKRWP